MVALNKIMSMLKKGLKFALVEFFAVRWLLLRRKHSLDKLNGFLYT